MQLEPEGSALPGVGKPLPLRKRVRAGIDYAIAFRGEVPVGICGVTR